MRRLLVVLLLASVGAIAQEGFPLDGTWRGERPATGSAPTTVVLIIQWDGKQITGTINPGPNAVDFTDAKLIPEGWRVTIAAKTARGEAISFDGAIGELGSYHRVLTGKWTEGGRTYDIRFTRE
jgi:hypothetical protein